MTAPTTIPHRPDDVTAAWLSAVLDAPVTGVVVAPVGTGQTGATYRVTPTYADTAERPAAFVVKLPSQDEAVRERVALSYRAEHAFYRDVAGTVSVPLPTVHHCAIDRDGADFVLLMDDLAPAVQGDQLAGCTPGQAQLAVEALAGLHGPRWSDPSWDDFTGATMPRADRDFARGMREVAQRATEVTVSRLGGRLSGEDQDTMRDAAGLIANWLLLHPGRFCLLHGDYRLDNLLFDPSGTTITVVDWQTLTIGLPARDLSYFLATSLQPEVRAADEHRLVADYHRALGGHGVTGYPGSQCWQDYRLGMLQVPLITTLGHAFSAATDRGDEMALIMLQRGCRAIRELDTLALIGELTSVEGTP